MQDLLIINISSLLQVDQLPVKGIKMKSIPSIESAWLYINDGKISSYGKMPFDQSTIKPGKVIDASGCLVFPAWCDSHTHIVYAGSREGEFRDRLHGLTYEEIANRGGGILNSARLLRETSADDL